MQKEIITYVIDYDKGVFWIDRIQPVYAYTEYGKRHHCNCLVLGQERLQELERLHATWCSWKTIPFLLGNLTNAEPSVAMSKKIFGRFYVKICEE